MTATKTNLTSTRLDRAAIGGRIRELRKRRGFTALRLGTRAGVNKGHLCLIEQGKAGGSLQTMAAIAVALRTTVDQILYDKGWPSTDPLDAGLIDVKAMGRRIRRVRLSRSGSERTMAAACGFTIADVRGWERGSGAIPDAAELVRLAIYLRRSIDFLLCNVSRRGALWRMAEAKAKKQADAARKAAT